MQDFYGDKPFIIDGKTTVRTGKTKTTVREKGVSGAFTAKLALVFLVAIALSAVIAFKTIFTVTAEGREYYAVCFYSGQSSAKAEEVRAGLIASGGSGYIISDGEFRVYGGVYADKSQADSVASKEEGAFVESIGWDKKEAVFYSSAQAKLAGEALSFFAEACDALVVGGLAVAKHEESALAVSAEAMSAADKFQEYSQTISDDELSEFFSRAAYSARNLPGAEEENFVSSLRYIAQDLIMLRRKILS